MAPLRIPVPSGQLPGTGEGFMNRAPPLTGGEHLSVNRGRGGTASEGRERRDKCYRGSPPPPVVPPAEGGFPEGAGVSTRLLPGFFGGPNPGASSGDHYYPLLVPGEGFMDGEWFGRRAKPLWSA